MEIKIQNVSMTYPSGKQALKGLNLELKSPSLIGLLGPNGAGKSTLMKLLVAALQPTGGNILLNGVPLAKVESQLKASLGYLPQDFGLFDELTVTQFLDYMAALKGISNPKAAIQKTIQAVNLEEKAKSKIRTLSGGQRQRVGIAQALLGNPPFLILDEPTVGLDPAQMIEIRSLIHDLGKTHTVILSSHILSEVQTVCDRVLIISGGKLIAQGTPEELAVQLAAKGTISATAQGSREAVLQAAAGVAGLTDLRVTAEKGGEVSFTAVSQSGADLRGALSLALAKAGCPVLTLSAESMSLEDVFLQLTENPEEKEEA